MTDANDILMGSGASALKFEIGTQHTGTVVAEPTASQQTDFRTKVPETWADGSPKMQVVITLQTSLRDPEKPHDDGTRALYVKGKHLTDAVRNAVRAAGARGIHTGGQLTIMCVGEDPPAPGLEKGAKQYAAQYVAPTVSFAGVTAPAAAQPAQQQTMAPAQQPAHPPAQAQVAQAVLGTPAAGPARPAHISEQMWAGFNDSQKAAIAASAANQMQPQY